MKKLCNIFWLFITLQTHTAALDAQAEAPEPPTAGPPFHNQVAPTRTIVDQPTPLNIHPALRHLSGTPTRLQSTPHQIITSCPHAATACLTGVLCCKQCGFSVKECLCIIDDDSCVVVSSCCLFCPLCCLTAYVKENLVPHCQNAHNNVDAYIASQQRDDLCAFIGLSFI